MPSNLSKVYIPRVRGNRLSGDVLTNLGGLDLLNPPDFVAPGRSPDGHDFRIKQESEGGRQVTVSTRKGAGKYTNPLGEHPSTASVSTTGASTAQVGVQTEIHAQPFIALHNEHLTRLDLDLSLGTATSTLRVDIYDDDNGLPGTLLTSSSFLEMPDVHTYAKALFLNAPTLEAGEKYWFMLYLQDDGTGFANLQTTTDTTDGFAWKGNSFISLGEQTYGLNYQIYTSPDIEIMEPYRFNREDGINRTLVPMGTTMYMIDEATKGYKVIADNLSPNATDYSFANGDGKVFWVNGHDPLTAWNGTFESENPNIVQNPSFDTNTSGWSGVAATITRITSDFNTSPAALQVATTTTAETGAKYQFPFDQWKKYKITFWAKAATAGRNLFVRFSDNQDVQLDNLTTTWTKYETYYTPTNSSSSTRGLVLRFNNVVGNVFIDDVEIKETGLEYILDGDIETMREIVFHKDRIMGVSAGDPNKILFSENPGNPSDKIGTEQWYYQWLTVSFIYIPRPFNGSPITSLTSFQGNLVITTQDEKYILSGDDRGNYYLRLSTGSKGALSRRGVVADANYIYFIGDDGAYRFNGSQDEKISMLIKPLFDKCPRKHEITLALWKNQLRAYMASEFSTVSDITAILDQDINEWYLDTDTYVSRALYYSDADDQMELVEFSSQTGTVYYAEQDFNALGAPIDFNYSLSYDSRGTPGQRKKFKRYVPLVQAVGKSFPITFGKDKDFENEPIETQQQLKVGGAKIGEFLVGDGTIITGATAFKPKKTPISGYSYYMQFRVMRKAVNNQVAFMGVQFTYKTKKL